MRQYYHSNTNLHLPPFEVICTSHKKEHIFICMCVSVSVCVCVCKEDVHEKRVKKEKRSSKKSKEEKKTNTYSYRQTDRQTDR